MSALIPLLVLIFGIIMFYGSAKAENKRVGEIAVFVGLFITVWPYMNSVAHVFGR